MPASARRTALRHLRRLLLSQLSVIHGGRGEEADRFFPAIGKVLDRLSELRHAPTPPLDDPSLAVLQGECLELNQMVTDVLEIEQGRTGGDIVRLEVDRKIRAFLANRETSK